MYKYKQSPIFINSIQCTLDIGFQIMVMHVELQATCSSLGYIEGQKYIKEPDCLGKTLT